MIKHNVLLNTVLRLHLITLIMFFAISTPLFGEIFRTFSICPTTDSIIVCWESNKGGEAVVKYGIGKKRDQQMKVQPYATHPNASIAINGKAIAYTAYLYKAELTGLSAGTQYSYQAEVGGDKGSLCSFKTGPKKLDKLTFIAYGDTRSNPVVHAKLVSMFPKHKPDLILHCGDFVMRAHKYNNWNASFFQPAQLALNTTPLIPTKGNHEKNIEALKKVIPFPDDEMTAAYWLEYSEDLHILILRDTYDKAYLAWAEKKLAASKAKWKIAMGHYPTYNMGGHTEIWGYYCGYNKLFSKYGVDVYFQGDSHQYERFAPVTPFHKENGTHVVQYITSAGGGASLYEIGRNELLLKTSKVFHYTVWTIDGNKLSMQAVDVDGKVFDEHVITKNDDGTPTDEYRKTAVYEEALQVSVCLGSKECKNGNLYAQLSGVPSPDNEVTMTFNMDSAKIPEGDEVGIIVRLSEESQEHYELLPTKIAPEKKFPMLEHFTAKLKAKVPVKKTKLGFSPMLTLECEYTLYHKGKSYYTGKTWCLPLK